MITISSTLRRLARRRMRGMSLIEVLTTVLIFSVGLIALVGLQNRAVQVSTGAEDTNRAALLANELASEMRLQKTFDLPEAQVNAWKSKVANGAQGGLPGGTAVVTVTATNADILITWRAPTSNTTNRYRTQVY